MQRVCKSLLLASLSLPAFAIAGITAESTVYFGENFRNYTDVAPGTSAGNGISVGNDPIYAGTSELNVNPKENGFVFIDFQKVQPSGNAFEPLLHFVKKISSNNDLQLVVWKIKDFQSHVLMIAVTVGLSQ